MASYTITNRTSGAEMGTYQGATADDALLAMVRDGGGPDAQVEDEGDWIVTEVTTLRDVLAALPDDVRISDGADDWDPENLLEALNEGMNGLPEDHPDFGKSWLDRQAVVTPTGIALLDESGYQEAPEAYSFRR